MQDILNALSKGLKSQLQPKMLVLTLWPMLLALLFWGGVFWWFWDAWAGSLVMLTQEAGLEPRLAEWGFAWVAHWLITLLLLSLLLPAVYVTSLLFAAVFAMPVMLNFVVERDYPNLEMKRGGTFMGSVWNGLIAVGVFLILWIITLPLWLIPFGALVAPTLLSAYLNQRLFMYDALMDHASREEFEQIKARANGRLFGLGAILGFVHYIPILNFFTPIYIGLAYIHFCLGELQRLREENM
ncbi:MAG: EI24 domain-containing protein [Hydrogenophilales bacterium]|nr:EI24 domain-containing protein [Hydrogenophilales bacterium]